MRPQTVTRTEPMARGRKPRVNRSTSQYDSISSDFETIELLSHAPWRHVGPTLQRLLYKLRAFGRVASRAGIRNFKRIRGRRGDEFERVCPDVDVGYSLLDLGHMATYAIAPGTSGFMMRMRLNCGRMGAVRRVGAVTFETKDVRRFHQISVVL